MGTQMRGKTSINRARNRHRTTAKTKSESNKSSQDESTSLVHKIVAYSLRCEQVVKRSGAALAASYIMPTAHFLSTVLKSDNSKSLAAALFYGTCSISMNFLNKAVVSSYNFNYPFFIMVCQMVTTIVFLDTLRMTGFLNLPPYSFRDGKDFLPASLLFALHATLSLFALHGMNIPMYGAIKRCTPLVSLILSVIVLRKAVPSKPIVLSILLITLGCLIASIGDLEFDGHAYFMGLLSVFAQGGYLTLVQRSSSEMKKSTLEMIHINGFNTLPFFAITSIAILEPVNIAESNSFFEDGFISVFVTLVLSGCILTFSQFLCASVCSAVTASLVGVGKSVLQTIIGFFTFGGVRFHPLNILGLILNTAGGALYSYVKYYEGERKKKQQHVIQDSENSTVASSLISNGINDQNGFQRRHRDRSKSLTTEEVSENGIWTHIKYENEASHQLPV